ncbi:Uncharacterized protein QJS10_CPB19g01014 [Acorus calamus]|uniref:O-fucosyltransferase family protein n=1 Tax=Acorus calamus TaxID=4465 RepID=A0AAV9CI30_ACOCL|nr:Uncharacterized protein QJS10_CPB19g01014 [Acorus calamus]
MAKRTQNRLSYISVPSQFIHSISSSPSLHSLLISPTKNHSPSPSPSAASRLLSLTRNPKSYLLCLSLLAFLWTSRILLLGPDPFLPCSPLAAVRSRGLLSMSALPVSDGGSISEAAADGEFWRQPEGYGYRGCVGASEGYRRASEAVVRGRRKYLMVVVSGGLNQQRNQIVDAVVIARILGAALVVPILQVNVIWGDESEFSDIFDLKHFKKVLVDDVRVVSSLPSTHVMTRPVLESRTPLHVSARWILQRYSRRLNKEGVLLLRGLDSRLSKDLPLDLQKLRCKVAFHALKFSAPILDIGNRLADRMRKQGPYLALHLRMEKDVWVRTGCLPGLSEELDQIVQEERKLRPELLTARSNMTFHERKLAGLCPLNALEVARFLKALGAPRNARIFWAGGEPFGGEDALLPLTREFPNFYNKDSISLPGELEPFAKRASLLAAIDFVVSERADVFMPSHGGNMNHAMQGLRAYAGHRKHITPNKREIFTHFLNTSMPEPEFNRIIKELHKNSLGLPEMRTDKVGRDVTAYPVQECMCNDSKARSTL